MKRYDRHCHTTTRLIDNKYCEPNKLLFIRLTIYIVSRTRNGVAMKIVEFHIYPQILLSLQYLVSIALALLFQ